MICDCEWAPPYQVTQQEAIWSDQNFGCFCLKISAPQFMSLDEEYSGLTRVTNLH